MHLFQFTTVLENFKRSEDNLPLVLNPMQAVERKDVVIKLLLPQVARQSFHGHVCHHEPDSLLLLVVLPGVAHHLGRLIHPYERPEVHRQPRHQQLRGHVTLAAADVEDVVLPVRTPPDELQVQPQDVLDVGPLHPAVLRVELDVVHGRSRWFLRLKNFPEFSWALWLHFSNCSSGTRKDSGAFYDPWTAFIHLSGPECEPCGANDENSRFKYR